MILVAILALATSATLTLGSIAQRRAAEEQLLEVGAAYRRAIASYLAASPAGDRRYPATLADLLKDPRYPGVRRHLRQLYRDPITGQAAWGLVRARGSNGIIGVHSLSQAQPIKIAEFSQENQLFEGRTRYSEWVFLVQPGIAPAATGAPGQGLSSAGAGLTPSAAAPLAAAAPNSPNSPNSPAKAADAPSLQAPLPTLDIEQPAIAPAIDLTR